MTFAIKTKQDLTRALNNPTWQLVHASEVMNRRDVQNLTKQLEALIKQGKKLCVPFLVRQ